MLRTFFEQVYMQVAANPGALSSGTSYPASYINVQDFERFAFLIALGATDQTAINAKVVQATAAAGTGSKDVSGAAITQLGATDDNKYALIEVQTDKLDINNAFHYVSLTFTATGGSATTGAVLFFGINPGSAPVSIPAAFVEQVAVLG